MDPRIKSASEWLTRAREDFKSARVLMDHEAPLEGPACFHAQQAAEKALKCFLVACGAEFDFVHNLEYLLNVCEREESAFGKFHAEADALAPFAVDIRYPGGIEVSAREAQDVLLAAQTILEAVVQFLPQEVTG